MDDIIEEIRKVPAVQDAISLPAERTFKINVHFATEDAPVQVINKQERKTGTDTLLGSFKRVSVPAFRDPPATSTTFSERDIALIRALQASLPIIERPYLEIAKRAGMTEDEVIARVREWLDAGVIRRFGARVKHQAIGYTANGMSVWDVPPDHVEAAGKYMASFPEVSHCYTRPRMPQWPYNLYAMIHGKQEQEVRSIAFDIAAHLHLTSYEVLFSTRELKKSAPTFF
jgi:DNA-binding Lrp family transcriptional regulator